MKRTLVILLAAIACLAGSFSCKRTVDYFYYETIVFDNRTGHNIKISTVESYGNPFEATILPYETFRETKEIGNGINPYSFIEVSVTFDNEYSVIHKKSDDSSLYHNICHENNYVKSKDPDLKRNTVNTFTFTEDDYDYAVAASGK